MICAIRRLDSGEAAKVADLARHAGDAVGMHTMLNAKGFVWQDDDDHWIPNRTSIRLGLRQSMIAEP